MALAENLGRIAFGLQFLSFLQAAAGFADKNLFYGRVQNVLLVENQPCMRSVAAVQSHRLTRFKFGPENAHLFLDFSQLALALSYQIGGFELELQGKLRVRCNAAQFGGLGEAEAESRRYLKHSLAT